MELKTILALSWQVELIYNDHYCPPPMFLRKYDHSNCLKLPSKWIQVLTTQLTNKDYYNFYSLDIFLQKSKELKKKQTIVKNPLEWHVDLLAKIKCKSPVEWKVHKECFKNT